MKTIFLGLILTLSFNTFSSTKDCSKMYQKEYQHIEAYTLVKVFETKSLCGFQVTYNQERGSGDISKGSDLTTQIIQSKEPNLAIADKDFLGNKQFGPCEHSIPVTNQLECHIDKDLFSIIAKKKNEKVSISNKLEL